MTAPNSNPDTFERIISECEKAISKIILGQTLTTDSNGTGSYALGEVHNEVRQDIMENSLNLVCNAINTQLIKPLVDFNFGNIDKYPEFRLINPESFDKKFKRDKGLYDIGVRFTEKYIAEQYGLDEDDFEIKEESGGFPFRENNPFF